MRENILARHNAFRDSGVGAFWTLKNLITPYALQKDIECLKNSIEEILQFGPVDESSMKVVQEIFSKINSNEERISREQVFNDLIKERGITRF